MDTYSCIGHIEADDALELKHQAIGIHNIDLINAYFTKLVSYAISTPDGNRLWSKIKFQEHMIQLFKG